MKVALFGGSFNPIHNGHVQIANELVNRKIVDEIWFIPCGNHAFGKELASGKDRIEMIKRAIGGNLNMKVICTEVLSDKVSYTSQTIKYFKNKFRETEFYFIIGSDNLEDFHKWHEFEFLKKNITFILVKRPNYKSKNTLGLKISYVLEMENKISSTMIRNLLKNNDIIENFVPKKVEEYITKEVLYK